MNDLAGRRAEKERKRLALQAQRLRHLKEVNDRKVAKREAKKKGK